MENCGCDARVTCSAVSIRTCPNLRQRILMIEHLRARFPCFIQTSGNFCKRRLVGASNTPCSAEVTSVASNKLRLHRHPGEGRDPVALRSFLARPIRDLSHSENRKPEPLDSGLRRNDGWGRIFLMPFNRYGRALLRVVLRLKRYCRCKLAAAVDELLLYAGRSPAAW